MRSSTLGSPRPLDIKENIWQDTHNPNKTRIHQIKEENRFFKTGTSKYGITSSTYEEASLKSEEAIQRDILKQLPLVESELVQTMGNQPYTPTYNLYKSASFFFQSFPTREI